MAVFRSAGTMRPSRGIIKAAARRPIDPSVLISIRWLALVGQLSALLLVSFHLKFEMPVAEAFGVIGVSAAVNLWQSLAVRKGQHYSGQILLLALGFDVIQLAALLYLTGGLINPFAIFFLAPVIVSAALLDVRSTAILLLLVVISSSFLTMYHMPLPWWPDARFDVPDLYQFGIWSAILLSALFIALYVFWLASDARRTDDALREAEQKLAQDRQSSAVGALATAAAHKLGSPLNTITLVSHELLLDVEADDPHYEDIQLLAQEVERCRVILAGLDADSSGNADILLPASHVLRDMIARKQNEIDKKLVISIADDLAGEEPLLAAIPELRYALDTLIDNAADFAKQQIMLRIGWDKVALKIRLSDDGPGLRQQTLNRIGEPGNSTRKGQAGHKGLGIFLASDLVRQLGGETEFSNADAENASSTGAQVDIILPRRTLPK